MDEPEYRKAVREGKGQKECEELYKAWREAKEKSLEQEEIRKSRLKTIKPWENCPAELRRLFEETEGLEGPDKKEQVREVRSDEERSTAGAKRQQNHVTAFQHN